MNIDNERRFFEFGVSLGYIAAILNLCKTDEELRSQFTSRGATESDLEEARSSIIKLKNCFYNKPDPA